MILNSKVEPLFRWFRDVFCWFVLYVITVGLPMFLLWVLVKMGDDDRPILQILWHIFLICLGCALVWGTYSWWDEKKKSDWIK
jgi:hypothetical protein